jgi:hypothetical protein
MAECTNTTTLPIFTNIVLSELEADWTVSYTGPATPPQPAYVDDYEVGVAVSEIRAFDYRAASEFLAGHVTSRVIYITCCTSPFQILISSLHHPPTAVLAPPLLPIPQSQM